MEQILDLPVESERKLNFAGFWIRFGAYLIDTVILVVAQLCIGFILSIEENSNSELLLNVIFIIISILYFVLMESSDKQTTLGKMAVKIKVGDADGNRISGGAAAGRYFGKILSGLLLGIGYMMAGWDPKKQALHDKLADTFVFYE